MAPTYKDKDAGVVLTFNGRWVSWAHTAIAYSTCPCKSNEDGMTGQLRPALGRAELCRAVSSCLSNELPG